MSLKLYIYLKEDRDDKDQLKDHKFIVNKIWRENEKSEAENPKSWSFPESLLCVYSDGKERWV